MNIEKLSISVIISILISTSVFSQDKIVKKSGDIIQAKVIEIGETEIKYKLFNDLNGPTYSIDKVRLKQTIFENGRVENYTTNLRDTSLYSDQAKSAIKVNFLSPLNGYLQLNYERSLKPGRSYELALGLIGIGAKQNSDYYYNDEKLYRNAGGVFIGAGYKFMSLPTLINSSDRYSHVLNGFYAKPEFLLGSYGQNKYEYNYSSNSNTNINTSKETVAFGALIINVGKQWVLGDLFLIDIYTGIGYALDNVSDNVDRTDIERNHFGLISSDNGLGFTGGFKLGLLLNKKQK